MEESIKSRYQVDHVESGLPRWLIEAAFVCLLAQAAISWSPTMTWMENHARWAIAVIQTFGSLVMYVGLLRGMKPLYRPFCVWWHLIIALNVAGFVVEFPSFIPDALRLAVAISLLLVYLPLGALLTVFYRGRLRQVGLWMALYILVSAIVPVLWFLAGASDSGLPNILVEASTIGVTIVYAWVLRRILVA
ncbi:MAG: hypothetical protein K5945_11150 [Bacteroidaceae bacterium]|nr:hypothetical protein [Bacteroidaceae bacterium]